MNQFAERFGGIPQNLLMNNATLTLGANAMNPTAKLNADEARAAFPWIVGQSHIVSAERFGDHAAIVNMGRGAHAVIINDKWEGCCPTRAYALKLVAGELTRIARYLDGTIRC